MRRTARIALGLLLAGLPATSAAAPPGAELVDAVGRFLEDAGIPAGALAVVTPDGTLVRGFGRDADGGEPVSGSSRFYLGSCTKTLTAFAVMQLVDRGRVELEAPLSRYLPGFDLGDPALAAAVEVRHLLSHTSGIGTRAAFDPGAQWRGRLDHLDFERPPGAEADYSSLNFLLLGRLVESVTGRPYADYMREEVFDPLGMRDTTARREEAETAGLVQGHTYFFGFTLPREEPPYSELMVPAGYVVSTADDLARYLGFLLDPEAQARLGVLSPPAVERMLTPWDGGDTGAALGWGVGSWRGEPRAGHAGMTPGFAARLVLLPESGIGAATLIARNAGPFLPADRDLVEAVLEHVAGDPAAAPASREHWVRLAMLVVALWTLVSFALELRRHRAAGWPRPWPRLDRVWAVAFVKVALHVAGALWILRGLAEISLAGLLEFYPDLGLLLVLGVTVGSLQAVLVALRTAGREGDPAAVG